MKVKLLVSRAGPAGAFNRGDEIEVSEGEAERMVAAGQAVVVVEKRVEKAVKQPVREQRG